MLRMTHVAFGAWHLSTRIPKAYSLGARRPVAVCFGSWLRIDASDGCRDALHASTEGTADVHASSYGLSHVVR